MDDILLGLLAVAAGALFCFRGAFAFRIVIPIWGAFVGFGFGAGLSPVKRFVEKPAAATAAKKHPPGNTRRSRWDR